jgi:hypothetical protein
MNNVDEAIAVTEHLLKVLHAIKIDGQAQPQKLLDLRKGIAFGCLQNIADVLDGGSLPEELAQMLLHKPN